MSGTTWQGKTLLDSCVAINVATADGSKYCLDYYYDATNTKYHCATCQTGKATKSIMASYTSSAGWGAD